ncbi:MAG: glycosyltransferase [Nibricoccus sp.]
MKRLLIVSPVFPPLNSPDMQRVRMSLPYYRENGWEPIVLTVAPDLQDTARDDELTATVPNDIAVHRCGALPLGLSRKFGLGNLGLRAWWHLLFAGGRLLCREKTELVLLSNTQFLTFLLGRIWRKWYGVPYVIDLQDPWRTTYYEQPGSRKPPGGWKYTFARLQARLFEPWAFRKMSGFISVSPKYITDLEARYPWFSRIPSATIPFGASELDLAHALAKAAPSSPPKNAVRLVYTGAAGPITPDAANLLFQAFSKFKAAHPQHASRLRFEFHGTSYAPVAVACPAVSDYAEKHGVADHVCENPARIGHLDALRLQANADGLLLLGSIDPAYSPSKLYNYFLAQRPMLGLAAKGSVLEALLTELSCSFLVTFNGRGAEDEAIDSLQRFFSDAVAGFPRGSQPARNETVFREKYLARRLTSAQCALFERALAKSH